MFQIKEGKDIIVYGTGRYALRCIGNLGDIVQINYCVEKNNKAQVFRTLRVYEADYANMNGKLTLVCVPLEGSGEEESYTKIRGLLQDIGLVEFEDFIYYEWLYKDLVWLYGNCHMVPVKQYLLSSPEFSKKYSIYPVSFLYEYKPELDDRYSRIAQRCELWIHQDIQPFNQYGYNCSIEYLKSIVNENVKEIIFPNIFGLGGIYYPQLINNSSKYVFGPEYGRNGCFEAFVNTDYIINELYYLYGGDANKIIEAVKEDIIEQSAIINNVNVLFDKFREREKYWDIKIMSFVEEEYQNTKLFYNPGHPSDLLIYEMTKRLMRCIGINEITRLSASTLLWHEELPIYPIVMRTLDLKWNEDEIRKGLACNKICAKVNLDEYVKEYIWWRIESKWARVTDVIRGYTSKYKYDEIVIYPYGEMGKLLRRTLDSNMPELKILCMDNNSQDEGVEPYDPSKFKDNKSRLFLLATIKKELARELYNGLRNIVDDRHIVHIFAAAGMI